VPRLFNVEFVVDTFALGQAFLLSPLVFHWHCHSTAVPFSLMSSGGWTKDPLETQFDGDNLIHIATVTIQTELLISKQLFVPVLNIYFTGCR
jgi:hypothetical protein